MNEKLKGILYVVTATIAIATTFVKMTTGFARVEDTTSRTEERVDKHEDKIEKLERYQIEQTTTLKYINKSMEEQKSNQDRIIDMLSTMRTNG